MQIEIVTGPSEKSVVDVEAAIVRRGGRMLTFTFSRRHSLIGSMLACQSVYSSSNIGWI